MLKRIFMITLAGMGWVSCTTSRNGVMPLPTFDREGHRGCRGLMPENTLLAMLRAVDLGVTTLELDVVVTGDDKVICSHEPFFNHEISSHPDGTPVTAAEERNLNIFRMPFAETQRYDVGLRGNPRFPRQEKVKAAKPLLAELFDDVEAYIRLRKHKRVLYNIETKTNPATDHLYHPEPETFVRLLMNVIQQKKLMGRVIIQSFDYRTLKIVHAGYPKARTAALVEESDKRSLEQHIQELGFTPDIFSPHYSLVTADLVKACHERKMKVVAWTVNDRTRINALVALGVDGIITDYPDLFNPDAQLP